MIDLLQILTSDQFPATDRILPIISGCATFGATLALSTAMQKLVGISTATQLLPTINGVFTVCAASLASEQAAIMTHTWQKDPQKALAQLQNKLLSFPNTIASMIHRPSYRTARFRDQHAAHFLDSNNGGTYRPVVKGQRSRFNCDKWFHVRHLPMHEMRICLLGLITFKLLGGRFWAISPSSYTHLGSFARWYIPCTDAYATSSQRTMIEQMGRKWGCHTCGSRMIGQNGLKFRFVGDHMPPKSVADQMNKTWPRRFGVLPKVKFRFYPQCVSCSNTQGSILSKATHQLNGVTTRNGLWKWGGGTSRLSSMVKAATLKEAGGGTSAYFHGWRFRINHFTGSLIAASVVVGAADSEIVKGNPRRLERWQRRIESEVKKLRD